MKQTSDHTLAIKDITHYHPFSTEAFMNAVKRMHINLLLVLAVLLFWITPVFAAKDSSDTAEDTVVEEVSDESTATDSSSTKAEKSKKNEDSSEEDVSLSESELEMTTMSAVVDDGTGSGGTGAKPISAVSTPTPANFNGSATTQIPIMVPAGRGGLAPQLALTYNSGAKNGPVGVGWNLPVGCIQRSTKYGLDFDADDYIAANGSASELVSRSDWGTDFYGAKIEGAFTKYEKISETGGWKVTTKDGTKYFYGSDNLSPDPYSKVSNPANPDQVFRWYLDMVEDTNGNQIRYYYDQSKHYLKQITYGEGTVIDFYYNEDRPDPMTISEAIWLEDINYRLKSIAVTLNNNLLAGYKLDYSLSDSGQSRLYEVYQYGSDLSVDDSDGTISGSTYIKIAKMEYYNDQFSYVKSNTGPTFWVSEDPENAWPCLAKLRLGDFNGDGITDIAVVRGGSDDPEPMRIHLALGDGTFSDAIDGPIYTVGDNIFCNETGRMKLADFNGDGKTDVARIDGCASTDTIKIFLADYTDGVLTFSDPIEGPSFEVGYTLLFGVLVFNVDVDVKRINFGDFNGDGLSDILYVDGMNDYLPMKCYLADYTDGVLSFLPPIDGPVLHLNGESERVDINRLRLGDFNGDGKTDIAKIVGYSGSHAMKIYLASFTDDEPSFLAENLGPVVGTSDDEDDRALDVGSRVRLGDFNGDGKTDIARINEWIPFGYSNPISIWLSKGDGTFAGGGTGPELNSASRVKIGDFNGDGKTDIGFVRGSDSSSAMKFYMSKGDGTFADGISGPSFWINGDDKEDVDIARVHSGDFNGDGKADILRLNGSGSSEPMSICLWDEEPANFLVTVQNQTGGSTTLSYTPSSRYENKKLPYVLQTVSSITGNDGFMSLPATTFEYGGGNFDSKTREFRGFEWVKKINAEGVTEKSIFHQGEFDKGMPETVTTYEYDTEDDSAPKFGKVSFTYDYQDITGVGTGEEAQAIFLQTKVTEAYEDGTLFLQTQETYSYSDYETDEEDAHGSITQTVASVLSGNDAESITSTKTYTNKGVWVWRVASENVTGSVSGFVRGANYTYQTTSGNLLTKTLAGPGNPQFSYAYGTYGNLESETDPMGNPVTTQYDATGTYPWKVTNALGHYIEYDYDITTGRLDHEWDVNRNQTDYYYDEFGRSIQIDLPNGGQSYTTYEDDEFPNYVKYRVRESSTSTIDQYTFIDGFGRTICSTSLGEGNKVIRSLMTYDDLGREYIAIGPFFDNTLPIDGYQYPGDVYGINIPENVPYSQTYYDLKGRPIEVVSPDPDYELNVTSFSYDGLSTTITDPDGAQKTDRKDYLGRLKEVVEYNQGEQYTTQYEYNAAGDLTQVTNALGDDTLINYDTLGRKINMDDPDMGYWTYSYDANGNLTQQVDANLTTTTFTYDQLNRVLTKTYQVHSSKVGIIDQPLNVIYTYDNTSINNGKGLSTVVRK